MSTAPRAVMAQQPATELEEKQVALSYLHEAMTEARLDGVDGDCLAQACLFTALSELVTTYGEEATAKFTEGFPARIRNGEFSIRRSCQ
jgi:type II secretory pathway pseudopilin PulG